MLVPLLPLQVLLVPQALLVLQALPVPQVLPVPVLPLLLTPSASLVSHLPTRTIRLSD